jgi:hypothetical protein
LAVLPQLYPDGPLPVRLWKVMLGVSAGLVVIATVKNQYNFPTIDDLAEAGQVVAVRYRWVAVVVAVGAVLAAEPARRRIQIRLERRFLGATHWGCWPGSMPTCRARTRMRRPCTTRSPARWPVLEALNNVVRHAHAENCEVTVALGSGELVVKVADDGVGLGRPYVSGIGITSMRSRVQALGGVFDLGTAPDGGTLLQARIPVEP